jgi:hypothetical protein
MSLYVVCVLRVLKKRVFGGRVMSGRSLLGACALAIFANLAWGSNATQISYSVNSLGDNHWQYNYTVSNVSLPQPIKEFTINFDPQLCTNLTITTPPPGGWNAIVWQPEPFLGDGGAYDALNSGAGIAIGEVVAGFSVRFDWLGTGSPAAQWYEVVDTVTFATLDSGWTVPEPAALSVFVLGSLVLARRRTRRS